MTAWFALTQGRYRNVLIAVETGQGALRTGLPLFSSPGRRPMRMAEARLSLAAVAVRSGDLEQTVTTGVAVLRAGRRSLPSLLVAGELDGERHRRLP